MACGDVSLDWLGRCRKCKKALVDHPKWSTEDWTVQIKRGGWTDSLTLCNVDYPLHSILLQVLAQDQKLTQLHLHASSTMLDKVKLYEMQQFSERELFFCSLFKNNRTLTNVSLRVGLDGSKIGSALAKVPLVKLDLSNNAIALEGMNALRVLARSPTLSELNLRQNIIYPTSAPALCDLIKNLTRLDLGHNKLGPKGLSGLVPGLKAAPSLVFLNLEHNILGSDLSPLTEALVHHPLQYLNIAFNDILDEGVGHVAKMLTANCTLQELILDDNYIGPTGALPLMSALGGNSALTRLSLAWNAIGIGGLGKGLKATAEMLAANKTLQVINLCDNGIGANGCVDIVRELSRNAESKLCTFELSINPIESEGAIALATYIASSICSLTYLDLDRCGIGAEGAEALARALPSNSTLCWLNMAKNQFGASTAQSLMAVWESHASLLDLTLPNPTLKTEQDRAFRESYQRARRNQLARILASAMSMPMVLTRIAVDFLEGPVSIELPSREESKEDLEIEELEGSRGGVGIFGPPSSPRAADSVLGGDFPPATENTSEQ